MENVDKIFENFKKQQATSVAHDGERVNIVDEFLKS